MFKRLQKQHSVWSTKNFGEQNIEDYCLGLIEETGELAHSVLKRKQGIRNNEDHDELIKDAIGDITIYLMGYCNCCGVDLSRVYSTIVLDLYEDIDLARCVIAIHESTSILLKQLINHGGYLEHIIGNLLKYILYFCKREGIDYFETVIETWKTVSTRDWKKNPDMVKDGLLENIGILS